jgi:predicted ATPase
MYALNVTSLTLILCGKYVTANRRLEEVVLLADEKGTIFWKAYAMMSQGWISTLAGEAADAVSRITTGLAAWRSTGTTLWTPWWLSCLAVAHTELDHFVDAWHSMSEATAATEAAFKETLWEAEVNRTAGEITLMPPDGDAAKASMYFKRALGVARQQQAKSWELRAAMSLARLWRDQGKVQQARDLLAPVYGWFTEGFDTRDLKEAKALLDELYA